MHPLAQLGAGLQSAATNLVQAIYSQNGATSYVGLVPFASTVNVLNALPSGGSWMNPSFAYNPANVAMKASGSVAGWGGCVAEPRDANGFRCCLQSSDAHAPRECSSLRASAKQSRAACA